MSWAKASIGGLAGDKAHVKRTSAGTEYVVFSVASHRGYGEQRITDWHDCIAFTDHVRRTAALIEKGDSVVVEALISYRVVRGQDGRVKEKHTSYKVLYLEVMRGGKRVLAEPVSRQEVETAPARVGVPDDDMEPF
jgi:single-stranded DNA-binding protein